MAKKYHQAGGTDVPLTDGGTGSSTASAARTALELETVSQVEAEAGVATTTRAWTAERVSQAITALGGGGGGQPTSADWTINTETLAATKTLTDASKTIQYLDPDGADRFVDLPAEATTNPMFNIINTGYQGGRLFVFIDSLAIAVLKNGHVCRCYSNGVDWIARGPGGRSGSAFFGGHILHYGASMAAGDAQIANGNAGATAVNANDYRTEQGVPLTGTIVALGWVGATAPQFNILVGAVTSASSPQTGSGTEGLVFFGDSAASSPGRLQIRRNSAGGTGTTGCFMHVRGNFGYELGFGGSSGGANDYYNVNDDYNGTSISSLTDQNQHATFGPAVLMHINWRSQTSTGGHTFGIWKNGAESEAIAQSGSAGPGNAAQTTVFENGDRIAIRYKTGSNPGDLNIHAVFSMPGHVYRFGGSSSSSNYLVMSGNGALTSSIASQTSTKVVIMQGGRITKLAVIPNNTMTSYGDLNIVINGEARGTCRAFCTDTIGAVFPADVEVNQGDILELQLLAGNLGGNWSVLVEAA
jgi:hypothetical protein